MDKIVFATDFSENAVKGLDYAAAFAQRAQTELHLFHAYHPEAPTSEAEASQLSEEKIRQRATDQLQQLAQRLQKHWSLAQVQNVLKLGFAVEELLEYTKEQPVSLVVMGSRGGGRANSFFGSNTAAVIEESRLPALAVPQQANFKPIEQLLFAADLREVDFYAFAQLLRFANLFGAHLHIIHAAEAEAPAEAQALDDLLPELNQLVRTGGLTYERAHTQSALQAVQAYTADNPVDIIAMIPRRPTVFQKLFGRDLAKTLAFHDEIPLLALHGLGKHA
jgi:nucleotide-binding universal stress UspA family protein